MSCVSFGTILNMLFERLVFWRDTVTILENNGALTPASIGSCQLLAPDSLWYTSKESRRRRPNGAFCHDRIADEPPSGEVTTKFWGCCGKKPGAHFKDGLVTTGIDGDPKNWSPGGFARTWKVNSASKSLALKTTNVEICPSLSTGEFGETGTIRSGILPEPMIRIIYSNPYRLCVSKEYEPSHGKRSFKKGLVMTLNPWDFCRFIRYSLKFLLLTYTC